MQLFSVRLTVAIARVSTNPTGFLQDRESDHSWLSGRPVRRETEEALSWLGVRYSERGEDLSESEIDDMEELRMDLGIERPLPDIGSVTHPNKIEIGSGCNSLLDQSKQEKAVA